MSATGSANSAPYVDIWGSKSSSDPDTVYTIPSVRLGYLGDISMTLNGSSISCNGYGLYADNVYLNGTIISNSGTIGGFKLDSNSLHNGTWGTDKSVLVCTGTSSAKAVGGSASISGWCFTAGSKFGVTTSGDLYASNAIISGKVTSSSGTIGGFTISQYNIKGTNVGLGCANGHDYAFWAGNSTGSASPFRVGHDGSLTATKATITGTITSDNITATSGTIGSFKLDSKFLQSSDETVGLSATETNWAFWAGGSTNNTAKFRVTRAGTLYTKDIQATSGKIGKYTITGTSLWTGDGSTCSGIGGNQAFWLAVTLVMMLHLEYLMQVHLSLLMPRFQEILQQLLVLLVDVLLLKEFLRLLVVISHPSTQVILHQEHLAQIELVLIVLQLVRSQLRILLVLTDGLILIKVRLITVVAN